MSYRVRYTRGAKNDIKRLYRFLLEYDRYDRVLNTIAKNRIGQATLKDL